MGKRHCLSYSVRVNKRVDHLFELVQSDNWGTCHVSSTLGFRYFI